MGGIYSERGVGEGKARFCNLSAWYVAPQFRKSSLSLLMAMLAQRNYTFTNLTPSETAAQVMKACGLNRSNCTSCCAAHGFTAP